MIPLGMNRYIEEYFSNKDDILSSCSLTPVGEKYSSSHNEIVQKAILDKDFDAFEVDPEFEYGLVDIYDIETSEIKESFRNYFRM